MGQRVGDGNRLAAGRSTSPSARVLSVVLLVAMPTTKVGNPALSASAMAVTAAGPALVESLVVPTQVGSPSVASSRYFGFVSVSVAR